MCLLSFLMADSTFSTLPVFLIGGLSIRSVAGFSHAKFRNLFVYICDTSGGVCLNLLSYKY